MGSGLLIVEDDHALATTVRQWLEGAGYSVWWAESGADAERILAAVEPMLILLDLTLPDIDGLLLCSKLRLLSDAPIMIATGRRGLIDRVLGLKFGAADFLLKPLDLEDLLARVETILSTTYRTPGVASADRIRVGELAIDTGSGRVTVAGELLQLTPMQYRLLLMFTSSVGDIVSRQKLAALIWDSSEAANMDHLVDVHVSRLRQALLHGPQPAPTILTVRGRGYKLQPEECESNLRIP
ncbi:MAG: response regulator transcription factor [Chloroflexi bacterium]|nr:response regulator transcription factor [Chloroflexota bacterium]